jgi:F-type H+-transporting ATPase subunit b
LIQNNRKTPLLLLFIALASLVCVFLFVPETFAAEVSTGRKIWNNVMLWVNFGILVFLFIKYAKKPLVDHLKSVRASVKKDLDEVNGELDNARSRMTTEEEKMKALDKRIREIREAILELGEKDKQKIIEEAKINAEKMIQDAKAYGEYRMAMARKALADEMVDMAVGIAEERIAEGITDTDHDNLVSQFIANLGTAKPVGG